MIHDIVNRILDWLLVAFVIGVVGWVVYPKLTALDVPAPSTRQLLVECAPITRGETIRVLAEQVTMTEGTTRYFDLSDSSFHQTTAPCATFEVRGE